MKTITIPGKFTTFTKVYNKVKIYFSATGDFTSLISDLYVLCKTVGQMSMNKSKPMRSEIQELTIRGSSVIINFDVEVDEDGLRTVASCAFGRNVVLDITYGDEKISERVNNRFFSKITKTMERLSSAMGMTTTMELKEAVDKTYGYHVPINGNMYQVDAEQLYEYLKDLAASVPNFIIDAEELNDSYIMKRIKTNKCAICDADMRTIRDGAPLCSTHEAERNNTTEKRFKEKHHL